MNEEDRVVLDIFTRKVRQRFPWMQIIKAYEKALFANNMEEVGSYFTDHIVYWVAGLEAADWGYEDLERSWYAADDRVIVEIHERSRLESSPDDVMDQRMCVMIRFCGERFCEMRNYSDAGIYQDFPATASGGATEAHVAVFVPLHHPSATQLWLN